MRLDNYYEIPPMAKTDSYKWSHFYQRPSDLEFVSSYIESRGVEDGRDWEQMVVAGIPYLLETFVTRPLVTRESLDRMKKRVPAHGVSFNEQGWEDLLRIHGGYAPVHVQALEEGSVVPLKTPILQLVNTDRRFNWLGSWLETHYLRSTWYPSTVATQSFHIKRLIKKYMEETAGHTNGLDFMLHDFGSRGVSSSESAMLGGLAHMYSFMGSDTFEAVELAERLYGEPMAAYSVDSAEHSTITSFGGPEFELEAYEHLLDSNANRENAIVSVVSDSYDLWNAIDNLWGDRLKAKVDALAARGNRLVVRPDSGDPLTVPVKAVQRLMDRFGYTVNAKGYKVLPAHVRVLQGDGINEQSIKAILENAKYNGISAENFVFGMGGALLQKVDRDTLKFAMKASAAKKRNGQWYDVYKDPVDDKGKQSKRGRQAVVFDQKDGLIKTIREGDITRDNRYDMLFKDIAYNGQSTYTTSLPAIRARINAAL